MQAARSVHGTARSVHEGVADPRGLLAHRVPEGNLLVPRRLHRSLALRPAPARARAASGVSLRAGRGLNCRGNAPCPLPAFFNPSAPISSLPHAATDPPAVLPSPHVPPTPRQAWAQAQARFELRRKDRPRTTRS